MSKTEHFHCTTVTFGWRRRTPENQPAPSPTPSGATLILKTNLIAFYSDTTGPNNLPVPGGS